MIIFAIILAALALTLTILFIAIASKDLYDLDQARIQHKVTLARLDDDRKCHGIALEEMRCMFSKFISDFEDKLVVINFILKYGKNTTDIRLGKRVPGTYSLTFGYIYDSKLKVAGIDYCKLPKGEEPNCEITIKKDTETEAIVHLTGYKNMWLRLDKTCNEVYEIPAPAEFVDKTEPVTTEAKES